LPVEDVAQAIDDAEQRVRAAEPRARLIYLEPDLDRTSRIP
jgi:vacuolar-type H+-ATPase subunit H